MWRHRDFRLLWLGDTASNVGSNVTAVALPLVAVTVLDATVLQVTVLTAAAWLPWLLVGLPAGAWVDRLRRRPLMILCDLIAAALFLTVPVAAVLGVLTIGHLLAVALAAGLARVFFETAGQVYLPSLLPPERLAAGNAGLTATRTASYVLGPGIAGLVAQLVGAVSALLLDVVSFLVSALCLRRIRTVERPPAAAGRPSLRREIAEGLGFVARDPYLRVLTASGAAANIGLTGYQALLVVFLVREVGLAPGAVGLVVAAASLGGVAGAVLATRIGRRYGTARAMLIAAALTGPPALLVPLTDTGGQWFWAPLGGSLVSFGVAVGNVVKSTFRQTYPPRRLLGRITVSMQLLNYGTIPLAALSAGALAGLLGTRPAILVMTGWLAVTPLILLIGPLRRRRDLPLAATAT
ncbi:MFS transporter [Micromonospora endolithica]|uniref:MFS transporter n=1 Tax=Micromonospora endolithica TaxID=230091 RepID=A0A3A9ZVB2_9ACTN|nr:MFS transporter [Micromonospora endolithica]